MCQFNEHQTIYIIKTLEVIIHSSWRGVIHRLWNKSVVRWFSPNNVTVTLLGLSRLCLKGVFFFSFFFRNILPEVVIANWKRDIKIFLVFRMHFKSNQSLLPKNLSHYWCLVSTFFPTFRGSAPAAPSWLKRYWKQNKRNSAWRGWSRLEDFHPGDRSCPPFWECYFLMVVVFFAFVSCYVVGFTHQTYRLC